MARRSDSVCHHRQFAVVCLFCEIHIKSRNRCSFAPRTIESCPGSLPCVVSTLFRSIEQLSMFILMGEFTKSKNCRSTVWHQCFRCWCWPCDCRCCWLKKRKMYVRRKKSQMWMNRRINIWRWCHATSLTFSEAIFGLLSRENYSINITMLSCVLLCCVS